jgi:3-hydroxyethyl bacteriochlorophyllide a dehydrogenase
MNARVQHDRVNAISLTAQAVVLEEPGRLSVQSLALTAPTPDDVIVDIAFSGISTGTERLLWTGRMPPFPGMGYPLVPGYESVGTVVEAGAASGRLPGDVVFVPGARCYGEVRGLFGGAASRVVVPGARVVPLPEGLGVDGVLFALAATAYHALSPPHAAPDLIVGHGVLGRLLARITVAMGATPPTVWETNPQRRDGATGYAVIDPSQDTRRDYRAIYDVSGAPDLLDTLVGKLAKGGEVVLAGFYDKPLSFIFPPFFMREASIRAAAEWQPADIAAIRDLIASGALSLGGLVTHILPAQDAADAYRTAFGDAACLKMVLDWRKRQ